MISKRSKNLRVSLVKSRKRMKILFFVSYSAEKQIKKLFVISLSLFHDSALNHFLQLVRFYFATNFLVFFGISNKLVYSIWLDTRESWTRSPDKKQAYERSRDLILTMVFYEFLKKTIENIIKDVWNKVKNERTLTFLCIIMGWNLLDNLSTSVGSLGHSLNSFMNISRPKSPETSFKGHRRKDTWVGCNHNKRLKCGRSQSTIVHKC